MADERWISESRATYETLTADLSRPVIIEREGHPFGVFVAYDDYKRLKDAAQLADE
jgi:PHD/YefM family antitoxin component YafN of YafNO toxin-antitoxin module